MSDAVGCFLSMCLIWRLLLTKNRHLGSQRDRTFHNWGMGYRETLWRLGSRSVVPPSDILNPSLPQTCFFPKVQDFPTENTLMSSRSKEAWPQKFNLVLPSSGHWPIMWWHISSSWPHYLHAVVGCNPIFYQW